MKIAMIGQKGVEVGSRGGGIEVHVAEVSRRLADLGHEVAVYARAKYSPDKPARYGGVRLLYLPTIYTKNLEAIIHTSLSTIHALFQGYDVIHFHGVGPATLAWVPRIFAPRATVVSTFHSQDRLHQKWGPIARAYLRFGEWAAVTFPHWCISVSHAIQVYCRETFNREVVYIPNGANIKTVTETDAIGAFGLESGQYLLNVSRHVAQKGIHHLIKAFKQLSTTKKLVLVGAPSFTDAYERELRDLAEGDDRIMFLGFQKGRSLEQLYAHAYLYVHPSEAEGLPLVILEAMSYGTVPLVSDIPPNLEAIHGVGFKFKNKDVDDLHRQLDDLLHDSGKVEANKQAAIDLVAREFNWDRIASRIEGVYLSARH